MFLLFITKYFFLDQKNKRNKSPKCNIFILCRKRRLITFQRRHSTVILSPNIIVVRFIIYIINGEDIFKNYTDSLMYRN